MSISWGKGQPPVQGIQGRYLKKDFCVYWHGHVLDGTVGEKSKWRAWEMVYFLPNWWIRYVTIISDYNHHQWWAGDPWRNPERKEYLPSSTIRMKPLPTVSPEEKQDVKTQDAGPRKWRCISKEWFQWAQSLPSSHTKKSAQFFEIIWFSLTIIFSHSDYLRFDAKLQ